ncbi:transposon Ty3-I Gag-Pol polyprotein [Trichonephila clavipes]|nr:transposon Ty3-I Gag-Pol polyprotein [Trichonephila clavipes]
MDFPTTTTKIWVLAYYCNNADVQDNLPTNPDFTCVSGRTTCLFEATTKSSELKPLITIRGVEVAANQGAATILRDDIASTISDSGRSASLAANSGYLSRTEKPDVNSLWIVEQTSRSSLGQKRKGECQASQYKLYAANGTEIPTYGLKILTLDLGLRRPFQWPFIIAKVERGIIGADFLQKFQLLIDLHNRKLIDGVTNLSIKGEVATIQENNDLSTVNRASKYFNLLKLYPDLTKPNLVNRVVKHEVKHHILTTGQPVYSEGKTTSP